MEDPFPKQTQIQRQRSTEGALREWLDGIGLIDFADALVSMGVSCLADCALVEQDDLVGGDRGIGMNIIQARRFLRSRDALDAASETGGSGGGPPRPPPPEAPAGRVAAKSLRHSGPVLKKGFLPEAPPFDGKQLGRIRNRRYDAKEQRWVKRDVPLTDEELECWQEQARWLVCPITGKQWIDATAILGVGIYHAPRQVSDEERQRMFDWEAANALLNRAEEAKRRAGGTGDHADPWWSTFYVYPNVDPPDEPFDEDLVSPDPEDPESVEMGRVELMIGPAFDVSAYNIGVHGGRLWMKGGVPSVVKSKTERGVRHNDAQWNAMNFEYWISRDGGDNFIKKQCTNRLSFFIEDFHGQRVFPKNIRSQLSLLLWRDRNRLTLKNGSTDEPLLAVAVRKVMPRILLGAIMEVFRGTSTAKKNKQCSDDYIEYAIRTYLLIHQVSIKLVVYFRRTRDDLVASVLRWIVAPFSARAQKEWPHGGSGLLEFLIGASLVGVPWHLVREPFMRALFTQLVRSCPELKWHPQGRARNLRHLFQKQKGYLHQVLCVFSFFGTGRSVGELDRMYGRCAGTLPQKERDAMKARVTEVKEGVDSLESLWTYMGMETGGADRTEIQGHVDALLKFCAEADAGRVGCRGYHWRLSDLPTDASSGNSSSSGDEQRLVLSNRRLRSFCNVMNMCDGDSNMVDAARALAAERAKHVGYPTLNQHGELDRLQCNYEGCGRRFNCRDHLFRHLKHMVGDERMVEGYHESHFRLKRRQLTVEEKNGTSCPACGEIFSTNSDLRTHLREIAGFKISGHFTSTAVQRTPGDGTSRKGIGAAAAFLESYYSDPSCCVICKATTCSAEGSRHVGADELPPREVMLLPCGHLYACRSCGVRQAKCVVCDQACTDVLHMAHLEAEMPHVVAAAETPRTVVCVVCLEKPVNHIVVPCGHPCLCEDCAPGVESTGVCPIGRCPIESIVRFYGRVAE